MFQELGVLPGSEVFDVNPGAISREMGLNVVRAGIFNCDKRYHVSRENYGSYLLLYTREGTGIVATCGNTYTIGPGDFALIDCYHKHSYHTDTKWKFDWIHVKGNIVEQFYTTVASMKQNHVFSVAQNYRAVHTLDCLFAQLKSAKAEQICKDESQIVCYLMEIFATLLSTINETNSAKTLKDPISYCIEYIRQNLDKNIQIADLSALVNYSPYYFIRRFTREVGITPYEYIKNQRIAKAKFYLRTSDMSIHEISRLCGFAKGNNFSTAFRLATGETPTAYRGNCCSDKAAAKIS